MLVMLKHLPRPIQRLFYLTTGHCRHHCFTSPTDSVLERRFPHPSWTTKSCAHSSSTWFLLQIVLILILNCLATSHALSVLLSSPKKGFPLSATPQVWLSISSRPHRRLVLNWHRLDLNLNASWIGLYDHEPNRYNFDNSYLERVFPHSTSGKHFTSKPYEYFSFQSTFDNKNSKRHLNDFLHSQNDSALTKLSSSLWSGCVKYWIAYVRHNRQLVVKKCLRTRPRWMEENMSVIGHRSLLELALPGTHNAGSYEMAANKRFARLDKYIYCQDESIWNQLIYGVRFFDLRLAFDDQGQSDRDRIWIAHGVMRVSISLADVLEQVLAFMLSTHQEIIVLDFHRFEEGLEEKQPDIDARHAVIEKLILDYLSAFLVPVELGMGKSIRDLVVENKRIFVGYARDKRNRRYFHTNSLHVWPDTDDAGLLFRYLNERSCRSPSAPYLVSLMGALTPKLFGLIRDKYDGVRALAESVNHHLSVRVFEEWWQCMNVLSTDYFLGNNAIEFTIEANLQRERR